MLLPRDVAGDAVKGMIMLSVAAMATGMPVMERLITGAPILMLMVLLRLPRTDTTLPWCRRNRSAAEWRTPSCAGENCIDIEAIPFLSSLGPFP